MAETKTANAVRISLEDLEDFAKGLEGANAATVLADLKAAGQVRDDVKRAIARVAIAAASGGRKVVESKCAADGALVTTVPALALNGKVNITKLSIIGHVLIAAMPETKLYQAIRVKIGTAEIWSSGVNEDSAMGKIAKKLGAKFAFTPVVGDAIVDFFRSCFAANIITRKFTPPGEEEAQAAPTATPTATARGSRRAPALGPLLVLMWNSRLRRYTIRP
jgi:hypothetical protein